MGASNSKSKSPKQHKVKHAKHHKEPKPGQDVVRGQKLAVTKDSNANKSYKLDDHTMSDTTAIHYGRVKVTEPKAIIHTDIPKRSTENSASARLSDSDQNQYHLLENCRESHGADVRTRLLSNQTVSSDEEYLDVPAIIRSVPETDNINMNTIKQAKVNVKDRISFFKETNAPVLRNGRPGHAGAGHIRLSTSPDYSEAVQYTQPIPVLPVSNESKPRRASESSDKHRSSQPVQKVLQNSKKDSKQPTESRKVSVEPAIISDHKVNTKTQRVDNSSIIPSPDYDMDMDGGWTDNGNRMNTLDYFKQVPREHSILRGFEKAKPAARLKKSKPNSPKQNHFNKPKPPRNNQPSQNANIRPVSMFTPSTNYTSDPDITAMNYNQSGYAMENSIYSMQGNLVTVNSKTGQKYAADDTDYETLTRKKKIAGQKLAIGVMDQQTEKNFLKSLKRNAHFKHAKALEPRGDHENDEQLEDMKF